MLEHEQQRRQDYYYRETSGISAMSSNFSTNAKAPTDTDSKQSVSRYMQNKITKSTLKVIDDSSTEDIDYTGATMLPASPRSTSSQSKITSSGSRASAASSASTHSLRHHKYENPTRSITSNNSVKSHGSQSIQSVKSNKSIKSTKSNKSIKSVKSNKSIKSNASKLMNNHSNTSSFLRSSVTQNENFGIYNTGAEETLSLSSHPTEAEEEEDHTFPQLLSIASCNSNVSHGSTELCLPLPQSNIPRTKQMYGRSREMTALQQRLSEGCSITSLQGVGGVGKTHLAAEACQQWLDQSPESRFVVWINAATEYTLRVSYLEALQQVLMGNVAEDDDDINDGDQEAAQQGEIIIVAELLHKQLDRQRRKEKAKQLLLEKKKRHFQRKYGTTSESRDDDDEEETTQVFSEDSEDWADDNVAADNDDDDSVDEDEDALDGETMETKILAQLLWDSLLQGLPPEFEWVVVFQNLPGGMGGIQGPEGIQPNFFPTATTEKEEWSQGRILCTTRHGEFAGNTCIGRIVSLRIERLDSQAASKMLISQAVFDSSHEMGRENLMSPNRPEIVKESERIAGKLVGAHYLDGSPLMISTAVGQIVSSRMTLKEYYSNLKHQVAAALETSGYGNGKVQSSVKRETAMSVCLEQAMDNAHALELIDIVSVAAFLCADRIPLHLLGGDRERVQKLCTMNLLSEISKDLYSMHRVHQRTAIDAIITNVIPGGSDLSGPEETEDFLCTPDNAVLALKTSLMTFVPEHAPTWNRARSCIPHVEAIRVHHDLLDRKSQLSPNFNHKYYAEIIDISAAVLQWALKDRPAAFSMFQEALRLRKQLIVPTASDFSSAGSSNMKSDHATALSKTLTSLGSLAENDETAQKFYSEALEICCQTLKPGSKSIEFMTLYVSLADVEARLNRSEVAYDLYKKALELYFTIYGHNQNIYSDDQKMYLADTLQKIGCLAHHQMKRHAEAELYLEGTVTLLRHVHDDESSAQRDEMANALETLGSICLAQNRMKDARHYFKSALKMKTNIHGTKKWTEISNKYGNDSKDSLETSRSSKSSKQRGRSLSYSHNSTDSGESSVDEDDRSIVTETVDNSNQEYAVELVRVDSAAREEAAAARDVKLARTLHRLGVMAWNLGSMNQADGYFEKALTLQRSGYGADALNEDIAITLFSLGGLCNDLHNDHEKACEYYQKSLDCYYFTLGKNAQSESIAQMLHALGQSLQHLEKHQQAKVYLNKALDMKAALYGGRDKVHPDLIEIQLDLGKVSRDLKANEDARMHFKSALDGLYALHGKEASNAQIAATLTQLGGLSFCSGIMEDAKKYFQQCLDIKLDLYGKDAYNEDLAMTFNNLGSLHARLKNEEVAFRFFELALEQYNKISEEDGKADDESIKGHQARTLHNLGLLSFNLKQYEEAKKFYTGSLKLKSDVFKDVDDSPDLAITLSKLSAVAEKQGHSETAKYYQDQAIKRSHTFLETHKNLINKNLLPATPEEAAAMMALVPTEEGNVDTQVMLKAMDLWGTQDLESEGTKSCWYPFKNKDKSKGKPKKTKSVKLPSKKRVRFFRHTKTM